MMRLEHANIAVIDTEAMTRFLTTAFPDFRIRGEGIGGSGIPWRHVGNDDFYLALNTVKHRTERRLYGNATGYNHLGWEVDDLDALEARMQAAGYQANLREHEHHARRRSYFYDPDGNDWEFVEYSSANPAERNDYSDAT